MNKKNDKNYQRKDLMIHKDVVSKFEKIAKRKKASVKKSMEDVLSDYIEPDVRFIELTPDSPTFEECVDIFGTLLKNPSKLNLKNNS